jgi:hypothetical protein
MTAVGYNHVTLLGSVSSGPWHNPGVEGKPESAALTLAIPETARSGEVFKTFVRVEVYGKVVADALALHAGDTALIEGKIAWQRTGESKSEGRLMVSCWRIVRLASDQPLTGGKLTDWSIRS